MSAKIIQVLVAAMTQGYFVYRIYLCALRIPDFFFLSSYSHSVSDKNIVVPFIWVRTLYT